MNLLDWFQSRWKNDAVHWTYEFLDATRSDKPTGPSPILSGEHYFRISVAEMFLKNDRNWFTDVAPAVYSVIKLTFGNREETISHVAGPSNLKDLEAKSLNRGVAVNYPMTQLLPFNGGSVEIETGLVALPGTNDTKRLLNVLTSFSKTLAVPQLSIALTFAQPLVDGIMELVGANDTKLVLRLHDSYTQPGSFRSGYLAIVSAPAGTVDKKTLWVKGDRLHRGDTLDTAQPLTGFDYVLLRIGAVDERDDYHALSAIDDPYQSAIAALNEAIGEPDPSKQKDKMLEAERLLGAAKVAAFKSKELTFKVGRRQVIQALQKGFDEAKELLGQGAAEQNVPRTLTQALAGAMSHDEAILAGEVTVRDL